MAGRVTLGVIASLLVAGSSAIAAQPVPLVVAAIPTASPFASNASVPSLPSAYPSAIGIDRRFSASLTQTSAKPSAFESPPGNGLRMLVKRERLDDYSPLSRIVAAQDSVSPYPIERNDIAFDWEFGLTSPANRTGLGLDIGITPRASFGLADNGLSRSAGAQVALGRFLNVGQGTPKSWYLFAAADGKQVTWDLNNPNSASYAPGMKLGERVVVGDMQAGISIARFGGQLGLAYMQRDVSYEKAHRSEQFAAFSFSMKR